MKRNIAVFAALLLAAGLSQAAVVTLPSSVARVLRPVATMFGQGSVSELVSTLRLSPSVVTVQQAAPVSSPVQAPDRSGLVSPTPGERFAPVVDAPAEPGRRPRTDADRPRTGKSLDGKHDNGLHRGWYIGNHYGWYKQDHAKAGNRSDRAPVHAPSSGKAKTR